MQHGAPPALQLLPRPRPFRLAVIAIALACLSCVGCGTAPAPQAHEGPTTASAATPESIRPFHVQVPEADLVDLRRRISDTRWPDKETVDDRSQGVQLAKLQDLVTGFLTGGKVNGRPCDIMKLGPDSFLFTDDNKGIVYLVRRRA